MEYDDLTQATQNTQGVLDPRRLGRNNSGISEADISDVICVLHPCSPAAFKVVAETAQSSPRIVFQNENFDDYGDGVTLSVLREKETFILHEDAQSSAMDLALRFSARVKNPHLGFVFGRHPVSCDIVLAQDTYKRVSNMHFRIFINFSGVLMLQDMSTNGTIVDDVVLKSKMSRDPQTRMLNPGSIIQILSPKTDEMVKFIVRIPSREGYAQEYQSKVQSYLQKVNIAELQFKNQNVTTRGTAATQIRTQGSTSIKAPVIQNQFGMHWSGGEKYNVVGRIGKGAFATVYQLATKAEGQLYAAKELEKRKFMKNGILDRKLDNEMQIMKAVSHQNIVRYVEYQDYANHMYIIMEFVPGGDLQEYLAHMGPLPEPVAKRMAAQVLDALAYLHKKKITHRDIKPDNILLADLEPDTFTIKLSDFGLSKVVQDNADTFLKTFCGTLLYCAPEVFPHYDAHVGGKGKKRTRQSKGAQASKFHSYSQSVDIWSFGAVLWYSLCTRPPFEGVADTTGRGMFDKIMMTPLDVTDLVRQGISDDAIALLITMLNTDPATRPSPVECLRHPWFGFGDPNAFSPDANGMQDGLVAIAEEEEAEAEDEPDVSSLSLDEGESDPASPTSEVSINSGSLEFLDPRQSKRFKSEVHAYREHDDMVDSSPELFYQSIPIMHQPESDRPGTAKPKVRKLFGEISQSALQDSTVLGQRAGFAVQTSASSGSRSQEDAQYSNGRGVVASPSLLGAESMVRDMNMDSPQSTKSYDAVPNEPITPMTPENVRRQNGRNSRAIEAANDVTPRAPQPVFFSRQINIPIPASFYYEADDPSTHTLEYATKKSGRDYLSKPEHLNGAENTALLATRSGSVTENDDEIDLDEVANQFPEPPTAQTEFIKPAPRLGGITSTTDSFEDITLCLSSRLSHWGREPSNTHVFADKQDTRIPKRAFAIWFHARGIDSIPENDQSWMKLPDLHCVISTESRIGILVNGVKLRKGEHGRTTFGRIYTGDVITVLEGSKSQDNRNGLRFLCEFYHGQAKELRPADGPRFKIDKESTPEHVQRERSKSKGKEKENIAIGLGVDMKTVAA